MKRIGEWIKEHKAPSAFIAALLVVALAMGIWSGLAYLVFEDYHLTPVGGAPRERVVTEGVVYHHTAASDRPITDHHRYHLTRGWLMVGYHYQIRQDGSLEIGRPHNVVGAHAGSTVNGRSIGVAFSGNMDHSPPTDAQYRAAIDLHYWLENEAGAGYGQLEIWEHKDFMNTSCAGKYVDLDIIRAGVEMLRLEGIPETPKSAVRKTLDVEELKGYVRGQETEGYLIIEEGRVYVPLRWVAEELGHDVSWDGEARVWGVE